MPAAGSRRGIRILLLVSVSWLAMGVGGCGKPIPEVMDAMNNTEQPHWITSEKDRANPVAVVFVHGIFGTTRGTWTNKDGKTFFDFIKKDRDVGSRIDVYAFGYTSDMFKEGSLDIYGAAEMLDAYLEKDKVWDYNTVVFVGHSMGGLVAMQLLLNKRNRISQVPLMVLYATPQEGSTLAAIGKAFSPNPALAQMVENDPDSFIVALDNNWAHMLDDPSIKKIKPRLVCAHETKSIYNFKVVSKFSSTKFCDGARNGIGDADHISIAKPSGERAHVVLILANELKKVLGSDRTPRLGLLGFEKVGDSWVYDKGYFNVENSGAILQNETTFPVRYYLSKPSPPLSNLYILPSGSTGTIEPKGKQELGFLLMNSGQQADEYRFTVDSGSGDQKSIVVKIPDPEKTQREASDRAAQVLVQLNKEMEKPEVQANLLGMNAQQQQNYLIELASKNFEGLGGANVQGDRTTQALLLADALTANKWSPLAAIVMNNLKRDVPGVEQHPAFQSLSVTIAIRSGDKQLSAELAKQGVTVNNADLVQMNLDQSSYETSQTAALPSDITRLSDNLRIYPGLRQYGLLLKADKLRSKGEISDASELYQQIIRIDPTPENKKMSDVISEVASTQSVPEA